MQQNFIHENLLETCANRKQLAPFSQREEARMAGVNSSKTTPAGESAAAEIRRRKR
jgi:hypothetical protein